MKTIQILLVMGAIALAAGCAPVVPDALLNARSAYQYAKNGPAAQRVPVAVHKAHQALLLAEESFKAESDTYKTLDLAYIAQRKAELAVVLSNTSANKDSKANAEVDFQDKQAELVEQGKQDVIDSEKKMADERAAMTAEEAANDLAASELRNSQAAEDAAIDLAASEQRTKDALAALAALAATREDERGLVLTLSGGVLFTSGQAVLLPSARSKLDQIAEALLSVGDRNIIIEGHTDSQGSESYNQDLSERRADAVRLYLVGRGYPSGRIQSHGMGEGSSVADNGSSEGRANNRRVEIIIERETIASSMDKEIK